MKINLSKNFGLFFLLVGGFLLLQNLNLFRGDVNSILWATIYGFLSIFIFYQYSKRTSHWWWFILGVFLFSFAISNLFVLFPSIQQAGPVVAIAGTGIGFILIFIIDRVNWWALIPGGVLFSLGIIRYFEIYEPETSTNGILFLGMGISFLLLYLIPTKIGRMNWALIPTIFLLAMGVISFFNQDFVVMSLVGPFILILGGAVVLFISFRSN